MLKWLKEAQRVGFGTVVRRRLWINRMKYNTALVGEDSAGNKYYQTDDPEYAGRNRWVEYALPYGREEASHVPPEWHGWLHYSTDENPVNNPAAFADPRFKKPHKHNHTGTNQAYLPTSFLYNPRRAEKSQYTAWDPTAKDTNKEVGQPQ